jgi:uncharacterized protein (TIGR02217 family)
MANPFSEDRLDLGIHYGTTSSYRYSTTILVNSQGQEQRNANWCQPLGKYQIGSKSLDRTELDTLIQFHKDRRGAYEAFRFRDWVDYQAINQFLGLGTGTRTVFQLVKTYSIGPYSIQRPIHKPLLNATIYLNGNNVANWELDTATGILTFDFPPVLGDIITADFEFDIPVRFEVDEINNRFEAYQDEDTAIFRLESLALTEVRLNLGTLPPTPLYPVFPYVLDLGYDYGTIGGNRYNTEITNVSSGYEHRSINWSEAKGRWNIGDRNLRISEKDYFLAFFRLCRGAASQFQFRDWAQVENLDVRFESDTIDFRFDAYQPESGEAIYNLSGLPIVVTKPIVSQSYLFTPLQIANNLNACYAVRPSEFIYNGDSGFTLRYDVFTASAVFFPTRTILTSKIAVYYLSQGNAATSLFAYGFSGDGYVGQELLGIQTSFFGDQTKTFIEGNSVQLQLSDTSLFNPGNYSPTIRYQFNNPTASATLSVAIRQGNYVYQGNNDTSLFGGNTWQQATIPASTNFTPILEIDSETNSVSAAFNAPPLSLQSGIIRLGVMVTASGGTNVINYLALDDLIVDVQNLGGNALVENFDFLPPISSLQVSSQCNGSIPENLLTWGEIDNATEYRIEVSSDNLTFNELATASSLNYSHQNLIENQIYYYRIYPIANISPFPYAATVFVSAANCSGGGGYGGN